MTKFCALTPKQALEVIGAAGVKDAAKLIRDHAAAGLVKSYADMQLTIDARGKRSSVRGGAVASVVWERIVRDRMDDDVWGGGTVRLAGSDLLGGEPTVHVTGVTFHPEEIKRLAGQQRPVQAAVRLAAVAPEPEGPVKSPADPLPTKAPSSKRKPNTAAIPDGAMLCSIEQAGEALGLGRTTVNKLINEGKLVRQKLGGASRITVESVRRYAGVTF